MFVVININIKTYILTDKYQWIQCDLLQPTKISGVVVQGRAKYESYITKFKVQYGDSINLLNYVKDKSGNDVVS